ncbi:MAG: LPS assembly protein LptD, partial [Deltaproteobacteria bacterium]
MKKSFYGHGSRSRFTVVKLLSTLIVLAAIVPSLSCLAAEKAAENLFKKDAPIDLTADNVTYDKTTNTYHAKGNVIIVQEGTTLKTDEAMINMESGAAYASGKVIVLDEGGNDIKADEMKMNMKEKTIVLARGRLFYKKENIHLNADVIRKTGKETYEAQRLTYTTCDCPDDESPAWNFYARDAQLTVGEYLTGWHSFFEIKGVPVLYTPYISVPIKRDRQTGFLQPKPGYSKLRGFVLKNSFFWAISRNTDATLYLDEETRRGLGKGSEFRYIRTRSSAGEANFYHFKEKDIDRVREFRKNVDNLARPKNATDDRWRFKLLHNESLFDAGALRANIDMVSDDEYFIDFGKGALERSLESLESNLSYTKNWSIYSLTSQMRFFNNLMTPDDRRTLQMLPAAAFKSTNQTVAGSPLYLSTESNFVNFARQEGATGQRLDLIPRLSLPMRPGEWFDLTPYAAPRATFYSIKDDPNGRYFDRYLYEAGVNSATTFLRVYL